MHANESTVLSIGKGTQEHKREGKDISYERIILEKAALYVCL